MKSVVNFVVIVLLSLCQVQSSNSQELAAVTPGMALETQLHDIRLDPKPLLVAQKAKPEAEPKKLKEKKASKKKEKAKKSDSKEADGESANAGSRSSSTAASGDTDKNDTHKSGADKNDADGDDTTKPVATQAPAKPAAKPAGKSGAKPDLQQFAGNASWYGVPFHGRKTASGEIFDMYKCSAAHKSLPMVSRVLVEDPRTGNTVLVRVNDRGPFVKTRVMDLSREAARKLGTMARGVYYIEATVLGK